MRSIRVPFTCMPQLTPSDYDDLIADGPIGQAVMKASAVLCVAVTHTYTHTLSLSLSLTVAQAPGGGELEKPLRSEKWYHGPVRVLVCV
jgi:hypothetical protein